MKKSNKDKKEPEISDVIGGTLDIFGLKIDLAKLLSSPEEMEGRLEELREKLKKAGGREVLSDEEWKKGEPSISGHLRTRGVFGEREHHIGTAGPLSREKERETISEPIEVVEPPVDVFQEEKEVVVVAEVPGVDLADLELKVKDDVLSFFTKPGAHRNYRKEIKLGSRVDQDSLKATCRNGILEVHLQKRTP
ncbi:MAG: Hsp20/alpha crystallin family protein [Coprothermobacterota bacterium]|nr:Hsp20/alpha crystallin family protein [Coprothermobacterota bacterium]